MDRQKRANTEEGDNSSLSQNTRQQNDTNIDNLSDDIMFFGIFTRLPAASLLRSARFVCSSWKNIIYNSPQFVEAHLRQAKPGLFIQSISDPCGADYLETNDNEGFEIWNTNTVFPGRMLSSCDGVMLSCQYATGAIYVGNPLDLVIRRVPDVPGGNLSHPSCALVRVPRTKEFKLFAATVQKQSEEYVCHWRVLRLGIDSSWTTFCITSSNSDLNFKCTPIYTGGNDLYWITEQRVIVMDVDNEKFREFGIPRELQRCPQYLRMGDCLSSITFREEGYQIHTFNSHSGQWTFYHHIGHLNYTTDVLSEFFCAWMGNELIIKAILIPFLETSISGYNVKTRNLRMFSVQTGAYALVLHTMSLVRI